MAWDGLLPTWGTGFDAALHQYQQALIYALRYNRFLLEDVLSGQPNRTPLLPIIPHCSERGAEGNRMLEALRDWWRTGANDVGAAGSVSPIPDGLALVEAEPRAWKDGLAQWTVLERINDELKRA